MTLLEAGGELNLLQAALSTAQILTPTSFAWLFHVDEHGRVTASVASSSVYLYKQAAKVANSRML